MKPHLKRLSAREWIAVMPNGDWLPLYGTVRQIGQTLRTYARMGMFGLVS